MTQPVNLKQVSPQNNLALLITAAIFFGLGFVSAYLLGTISFSGEGDIETAVRSTLVALTPPPTPIPTNVPTDLTFVDYNQTLGPVDAPVTMVEFSDYTCGYCGHFHRNILNPLLDHYDGLVRFVYREFPRYTDFVAISTAAQCAGQQAKFWEYTDLLWQNQVAENPAPLDETGLAGFAETVGLEIDTFNTCRIDGNIEQLVLADLQTGLNFDVGGTPTYFIEGNRIVGLLSMEEFMNIIDGLLLEKGIEPPPRT